MPPKLRRQKVALGQPLKTLRKKQRAGISLNALKPSTIKKYNYALNLFFSWLPGSRYCDLKSLLDLDEAVVAYVNVCWEEGEQIDDAANVLSGLCHYILPIRGHLNGSWKMISRWRQKELPAQAPPMGLAVLTLMIGTALECKRLPLAAGIALAFHCFLRTGELFALHCGDVQVGEKGGAVVLQHTKKGIRDIVSINDPLVLTLVKMRLLHSSAGDWFCDIPAAKARCIFADFLKALDLSHLGLRWYSLRRGGATHHFCKFGQMESTLVRGRWESSRTARIYLTEGMAALQETSLEDWQVQLAAHFAKILVECGSGSGF